MSPNRESKYITEAKIEIVGYNRNLTIARFFNLKNARKGIAYIKLKAFSVRDQQQYSKPQANNLLIMDEQVNWVDVSVIASLLTL